METAFLRELLGDIKATFVAKGADRLWSEDIAAAIHAIAGRSWAQWGRTGRPISQNQIARLLKDCNIYPGKIRIGNPSRRGYYLSQFAEAFERYLCVPEQRNNGDEMGTSEKPVPVQPSAAITPPRQRVITVKHRPVGPDEISHADWQALGCSTERLKLFLRQRDQQLRG
jgi:hypothetical protein